MGIILSGESCLQHGRPEIELIRLAALHTRAIIIGDKDVRRVGNFLIGKNAAHGIGDVALWTHHLVVYFGKRNFFTDLRPYLKTHKFSMDDVYYIPDQHDLPGVLRTITEPRDTVLTMGAGDISRVGDELLGLLG